MFNWLIKRTKLFHEAEQKKIVLEESLEHLHEVNRELNQKIAELDKKIENLLKAGPHLIKDGNSSLIFEFDNELNVTTKSRINTDIAEKLIKEGYIKDNERHDELLLQLTLILMANEVTEQIIEEVNDQSSTTTITKDED